MKKHYLLIIALLISTTGCSFFATEEVKTEQNWSAERIYSEAKSALDNGEYQIALSHYAQLESRLAIATLDRFMRVYPLNPNIDYAIYLRGLTNFTRDIGLMEKYIPRDESQRDPGSARLALKDFTALVNRYPKSRYSEDSAQRIVYLRNRLAQHEINVAQYYMRRGAYIAAANRGKYVIENYPRTPAMPDALLVMAKAYKVLELNELSEDALRVLELNYPGFDGIAKVKQTKLKK